MHRALMILALFLLAGCSLNNMPTPRATYSPVSDVSLYRRVANIPGVTGVELRWTNGFDNPNGYGGTVYAGRDSDDVAILDQVLAILRQGRPGADLDAIEVWRMGSYPVFPSEFGLKGQADYTARYGPQPGTGVPPATPLIKPR